MYITDVCRQSKQQKDQSVKQDSGGAADAKRKPEIVGSNIQQPAAKRLKADDQVHSMNQALYMDLLTIAELQFVGSTLQLHRQLLVVQSHVA